MKWIANKINRPNGVISFARRLYKQARCTHTHCGYYSLEGARRIFGDPFGSRFSMDPGLKLVFCYKCGLTWVQDFSE